MLDNTHKPCQSPNVTDADPPIWDRAPCSGNGRNSPEISKFGHGGARENSGGARSNAGRKPKPVTSIARTTEPRWFCARTLPNAERIAAQELGLAGFETYLPTIWLPYSPARRYSNGSVRPARPARVVALFARYLFIRFSLADPWQGILDLPGVNRLVTESPADSTPLSMPDGAIDWVRSMVSDNGCQYPTAAKRQLPIVVGSRARLTQGSLADHVGICAYSDGRRVRLLMDILGRAVTVTADRDSVEAAEPAGE